VYTYVLFLTVLPPAYCIFLSRTLVKKMQVFVRFVVQHSRATVLGHRQLSTCYNELRQIERNVGTRTELDRQ